MDLACIVNFNLLFKPWKKIPSYLSLLVLLVKGLRNWPDSFLLY